MLDTVFASMKGQAEAWRKKAAERRRLTTADAAADALDVCADELEESVHILETESEWLTPEEFGAQFRPRVSGQTVRNWIHRGELKAENGPKGYRIARRAARVRKLKIA